MWKSAPLRTCQICLSKKLASQIHPILTTKPSANKSNNKCKRKSLAVRVLYCKTVTVNILLSTVRTVTLWYLSIFSTHPEPKLVRYEEVLLPHLLPHQQAILCPTDDTPCVGGGWHTTIAHRKRSWSVKILLGRYTFWCNFQTPPWNITCCNSLLESLLRLPTMLLRLIEDLCYLKHWVKWWYEQRIVRSSTIYILKFYEILPVGQ